MNDEERQRILYYRKLMEKYNKSISRDAQKVEENMEKSNQEILVAYRRDERRSKKIANALNIVNQLVNVGLRNASVAGGYLGLALNMISNPIGGLHHALRTQYGEEWYVMGGWSNSVMGALDSDDLNYNYGSGKLKAFNSDLRLRLEQAEFECICVFDDLNLLEKQNRSRVFDKNISEKRLGRKTTALTYAYWRSRVLSELKGYPYNKWIWYNVSNMIFGTMGGDHDGIKDLSKDVFNAGTKGNPRLYKKMSNADRKSGNNSTGGSYSSRRSNLVKVLSKYEMKYGEYYKNPAGVYSKDDAGVINDYVLSPSCIYRVECVKALIVAYYGEVRVHLSEVLSKNLFELLNKAAPDSRSKTGKESLKKKREVKSRTGKIMTGLSTPLRILGAAMPTICYNANTTYESKKWARFLCAVSVFYNVLGAYFNNMLVCDRLPMRNSLGRFAFAYADACNTATEYHSHWKFLGRGCAKEATQTLKWTLQGLLYHDPGINTMMNSLAIYDKAKVRLKGEAPGLKGFMHLDKCGMTGENIHGDKYLTHYNFKSSDIERYLNRVLTSSRDKWESNEKKSAKGGKRTGKLKIGDNLSKGGPKSIVVGKTFKWGGGHNYQRYQESMDKVLKDNNVPKSLQYYIVEVGAVIEALRKGEGGGDR